ncbi:aminodeoxychorismate lyase [Paenibacillus physcomitrellae]|uniref:Endolytic murein transglycosylase n=2 Tax=Paenibacillus physcomitrellae TaxID=1619311 RepID=A0ABQ1GDS0_9BACL|nr:endolytic transglycosylase MltG [Paenibacillus physcomitrellae]GGA41556.1 aminodeoxychorismate lyase [Paenibacillus physcomitrellae]
MKKGMRLVLAVVLVLIIAAGGAGAYVYWGLQPPAKSDQPVRFTIEPGTGTEAIADLLQDKGLIRNSLLFKLSLKYKSEGSRFQAGTYEMNPGATADQIIAKLNSGDVVPEEMIRFTIPEGFTVKQMADKLQEEGVANAETFLKLVKDPASGGIESSLLEQIPADAKLMYRLEGYLFPETYELKKGSTEADMIQRMLEETSVKLEQIPDFDAKLKANGYSLNQIMTIASLVEREVVVDKERPIVAGVIYNRLKQNMKLEIDATVQYLLGKPKERLLNSDLRKVDSPYNSYLYEGLPPGPIAAPSLKSIEAALEPEKSDYLFYVTKKDGSQEHLFAATYQEHLANIKKSQAAAK